MPETYPRTTAMANIRYIIYVNLILLFIKIHQCALYSIVRSFQMTIRILPKNISTLPNDNVDAFGVIEVDIISINYDMIKKISIYMFDSYYIYLISLIYFI